MDDLQVKFGNMNITIYGLETKHIVRITHVVDPNNFFVRPIHYDEFIFNVETTRLQNTPFRANEYDIVMFNMKRSYKKSRYARGKICCKHVGAVVCYDIFAIDYGHYEVRIPEEFVRKCNEVLAKIPPLVLRCRLANCAPIGEGIWQRESINAFRSFVEREIATMTIKGKTRDKFTVVLKNSNPHDIATLMALCNFSTFGSIHNAITFISSILPKKIFYARKILNLRDCIPVTVLSGKSLDAFYVVDIDDYRKFMKDYKNISEQAKNEPKLTEEHFTEGTPVCVKNELHKYERAVITKVISGKRAMVKLVDWGIEKEAHIITMRYVSDYCMKIPPAAIYCSANKKHNLYSEAFHRLLCPGVDFVIEIVQLANNFATPYTVNILPFQSFN